MANKEQEALIVTERAVFRIVSDGLELIEVAPGIDPRTQVLELMAFAPVRIADPLPRMDARFLMSGAMAKPERISA